MTDRYAAYERLKFDTPGDRILRITMDAPGRLNAADETMHDELGRIWKDVEADPDVSVAILCGAGKAFSAGGDFDMIDEMIDSFEVRARVWKEARDLVYNVINCSKPIVSAMQGTRGSASRRAIMRLSCGRCFAAWRRRNITCCCASRSLARKPSASGWFRSALKQTNCRTRRSRLPGNWRAARRRQSGLRNTR